MADILDKRPVDAEMTIFKTEVEPNKLNACIDNILMRLDRLETSMAKPVNRWISVKDRLPDDCVEVLVYDTDCGILIGWYDKKDSIFVAEFINELDAVTHWMPLPEPPKDGDTE